MASFGNLRTVGVLDQVTLHSAVPTDFRSVLQVMSRVAPDEIYLLAGQSSVGLSFEQPVETLESLSIRYLECAGGGALYWAPGAALSRGLQRMFR